jgi:integrase/recombinase XerC
METKELMPIPYERPTDSFTITATLETAELIEAFLSGKSPKTIEAYKRDLEDFRVFLEAQDLDHAAKTFLSGGLHRANHLALKYKVHLSDAKKLQATTVNRKLAALRSLTDMAYTLGMINWKVRVKNQKVEDESRNTSGPGKTGTLKLLEEASKRKDAKGLRDKALLHLLYDLALRRSEVVGLDLEDVDLERKTIRVLGKGRLQKQTLTVPVRTRDVLALWVGVRGDWDGPLFVNFHHDGTIKGKRLTADGLYYIVKYFGEKTGQKVRPHGLRHTSISEAVRKTQAIGMDVTKVLKFSRHKNLNTLQVYIDGVEGAQGEIAELVAMD